MYPPAPQPTSPYTPAGVTGNNPNSQVFQQQQQQFQPQPQAGIGQPLPGFGQPPPMQPSMQQAPGSATPPAGLGASPFLQGTPQPQVAQQFQGTTPTPASAYMGGQPAPMQRFADGGSVSAHSVQSVQDKGRGNDTMLIHMTPREVSGLQALAEAHGGSLTTNPHTGLPEASFLESILPTLLGIGLSFIPGVGPLMAAGITGLGTTAVTGDLKQGLMAGLGAFGGASLAGGLGIGASAAEAAVPSAVTALPGAAGATLPGAGTIGIDTLNLAGSAGSAAPTALSAGRTALQAMGTNAIPGVVGAASPGAAAVIPGAAAAGAPAAPNFLGQMLGPKAGAFGQRFAETASGVGPGGVISPMRTGAAAMGVGMPIAEALTPKLKPYDPEEDDWNYEGPYKPMDRKVRFRGPQPMGGSKDSSEFSYFENSNPYPGFTTASGGVPSGYADGGAVQRRMVNVGPSAPMRPPVDFAQIMQASRRPAAPPMDALQYTPPARRTERDYGFKQSAPSPMSMESMIPGADGMSPHVSQMLKNAIGQGGLYPSATSVAAKMAADMPAYSIPKPNYGQGMAGLAAGGVSLRDGAFVVDARTVSELGNGSSSAGQELLARHGGVPIRGPGDGVSDSIRANVGGKQEARVARDEVKFDPEAVKRLGGGSASAGAKKLYALMEKAHKARKSAKRGQDTGLRGAM